MALRTFSQWRRAFQRLYWKIPLTIAIPSVVLLVGALTALAITLLGARALNEQSDASAAQQARAVSRTLAARISESPLHTQVTWVQETAHRSEVELLLVSANGKLIADGSLGPPSLAGILELIRVREGETQTTSGRTRFYASAVPSDLGGLYLVAFVSAPKTPQASASLLQVVGAFTLGLVGLSALLAYLLSGDIEGDIAYLRRRIHRMAGKTNDPPGSYVPLRSTDQIGDMTNAFNRLVDRFRAAEDAYRNDISRTMDFERDRGRFLAALSHELRTPLNAILGFTDVLLACVDGPLSADAEENLTIVRNSAAHLNALINDVLDLSSMEKGELQVGKERVDLSLVVNDLAREARLEAEKKGLKLVVKSQSHFVLGDALRLRQILGNLVSNAIKFTNQGEITISLFEVEQRVGMRVSDSGPGIRKSDQAAIFEEYQQVGDIHTSRIGAGLGLAITRRLVRLHHGRIELQSELGEGSTFTVWLPEASAAAAPLSMTGHSIPEPPAGKELP